MYGLLFIVVWVLCILKGAGVLAITWAAATALLWFPALAHLALWLIGFFDKRNRFEW